MITTLPDPQPRNRSVMPRVSWPQMGCFGLLLLTIASVFLPPVGHPRHEARASMCFSNLKRLSMALRLYAEDYDDRLPPARAWSGAIRDRLTGQGFFNCPEIAPKPSYAFLQDLYGRRTTTIGSPDAQPMLYDSTMGVPNAADHGESFVRRHPSAGGRFGNVAYADGHVNRAKSLWPPPARRNR